MPGGNYIKGFVLSVISVLILLACSVSLTLGQIDEFALIGDVRASILAQEIENETLWLDAYGDEYPSVYSADPLLNGTSYSISIEGTWSPWGASHWLDLNDPPLGPYEEAPMYTSGGTGRVGHDPFWGFAHIYGYSYVNSTDYVPLPAKSAFRISLDNGATWNTSIRPANDVYSLTHHYEVTVIGKGENIGFRIVDNEAYDNYGMFKIIITEELIVPSAPQNLIATPGDGQVVLAWTASANDGGSNITNYMVYRSNTENGTYSPIASPVGLTYTDTGLTNGQTYYYKVSANNSGGEGILTEEKVATPAASVPGADGDMTLIIAIVAVIAIAAIGAAFFFAWKKKKKKR